MSNAENSYRLALSLTSQLLEAGVEYVIASPGFRNSPLVLAARKTKGLKVVSVVDERGAGFLALGASRSSRKPVALLCTSGTAVANYYPAVMEANYSHVPLVVITADRPAELVGTGANQCADQIHFFGQQVRNFSAIEPSFDGEKDIAHAQYSVGKAVSAALGPVPGPVHLNVRFREPFLPDSSAALSIELEEGKKTFWKFLSSSAGPSKEQASAIENVFGHSKKTLILVGPCGYGEDRIRAILNLAAFNIPVLAENASGLSFGNGSAVCQKVDWILEGMLSGLIEPPELVIRFGAPLTSKQVPLVLKKFQPAQIIFDEFAEAREPDLYPSIFVQGGVDGWLTQMRRWNCGSDKSWREKILEINMGLDQSMEKHLVKFPKTEWFFHHQFEKIVPEGSVLFLGNSMPIRDFNSAFPSTKKNLTVHCNRGQSGIDGLLASAAGTALATKKETHAIIGDLSTLHDLSSFSILSSLRDELNLTIWVMNNGGGEIFRVVPTAKAGGKAEWFTTPQEFDLSATAKSFRIPFLRIHDNNELSELEPAAISGSGVRIIEVLFDGPTNLEARKSFKPL